MLMHIAYETTAFLISYLLKKHSISILFYDAGFDCEVMNLLILSAKKYKRERKKTIAHI